MDALPPAAAENTAAADASQIDEHPDQPDISDANAAPEDASQAVPAKAKKPKGTLVNADRPPGKSLLPLARVQRILKADKELPSCNKEAVFLISVATEEFIKRLSQTSHQQAGREKRATVQRKDVVTAVRRVDEFVFLEEILSAGTAQAPPPAPTKRKTKATPTTTHAAGMNIKDALGRSKGNNSEPAAASDDEDGRSNSADQPIASQGEQNEILRDAMDVS